MMNIWPCSGKLIRSRYLKAALAVNQGLIELYWEIGKMIVREEETKGWGSAVVERLAVDLKMEFPDMGGFSRSNLFYIRKFYLFYRDADEKVQQVVRQIPWGRFSDRSRRHLGQAPKRLDGCWRYGEEQLIVR